MNETLTLASASPRRRDLLLERGYRFEIVPADIEELMPSELSVGEITLLNAARKARVVALARPDALVLAADTLVALEGRILGKPRDLQEAFDMLRSLSGRTHQVFSGVCIRRGKLVRGFIEVSAVEFRPLEKREIFEYMERIGPLDKAGAYAAQTNELGVIKSITGSYTNVVGLPMERLGKELKRMRRACALRC